MMRKRWAAAIALLLLAACGQPPVTDEVTVRFSDESDTATVTAETKFDLQSRNPRVDAARNAALSSTDPWSVRFARVNPELDQVTFERQRGELARVVHLVRIPANDLGRVFSDTSVTVLLTRENGWNELTLLPGTSQRATREQQRHFEEQLGVWSGDVARYFRAIDHLYDYLDEHPQRAEALFAALVASKEDEPPLLAEEELPFVEAVMNAMERIATRMDESGAEAYSFAEEADLIFNPFPAKMTFRAPDAKDLVIEPVDLFAAIAGLEGKWISPDPLAALLKKEIPTAAELAEMPRKSTSMASATEIASAIREELARPKSYTLRWRD
jgi:hypothetical protein